MKKRYEKTVYDAIWEAVRLRYGHLPVTFTLSNIIIAAWESDKPRFGLRDFELAHPDSNKVIAAMSGKMGLVRRGYLTRVGTNLYRLGRYTRPEQAEEPACTTEAAPDVTARGTDLELYQRLLQSRAAEVMRSGRASDLTREHALDFSGLSVGQGRQLAQEFARLADKLLRMQQNPLAFNEREVNFLMRVYDALKPIVQRLTKTQRFA